MPDIFVNTDNSNPQKKLFSALKAGKAQAKAEDKMRGAVQRIIAKTPGFTTSGGGKGYAVKLSLDGVQVTGGRTRCSVKGYAVRWPPETNAKGEEGEVLATGMMTGNALADGTGDGAVVDCVEAVAEDLARKAVGAMREDFTRR